MHKYVAEESSGLSMVGMIELFVLKGCQLEVRDSAWKDKFNTKHFSMFFVKDMNNPSH